MEMAKTVALTAVSGLVFGLGGCGEKKEAAAPDGESTATPADTAAPAGESGAKACCKGNNECKAKGGCKTEKNECKGMNECKGAGGCKTREGC